MTRRQPDKADESERETEIALFRYGLIAPLLFAAPDPGQLEATLRQVASKTYQIPYSGRCRVSVSTLRRYLTLYQAGGFAALHPLPRADKGMVRAFPPEVLEAAIALRAEQPARTTPMLVELLQRDPNLKLDHPINAHTLTTQLRQHGHSRRLLGQASRAYRRFEREHSNSLWQGDAMVGPWLPDPEVAGKKRRAHLFCFLDDHSRLVPHAEFFWDEALPRLERVLKVAVLRRGVQPVASGGVERMLRRCLNLLAINGQSHNDGVKMFPHRHNGVVANFARLFIVGQHLVQQIHLTDGNQAIFSYHHRVAAETA